MKAKIISFDEVLERIKSGNVKNIYIIDILSRFVRKSVGCGSRIFNASQRRWYFYTRRVGR